jgi:hypothetical protein
MGLIRSSNRNRQDDVYSPSGSVSISNDEDASNVSSAFDPEFEQEVFNNLIFFNIY